MIERSKAVVPLPSPDGERHLSSQQILDALPDAVVTYDLAGKVLAWNKGAERLFGYQADQILGQSVWRLIPEDRRAEHRRLLEERDFGRSPFETIRLAKSGIRLDVCVRVAPVRGKSGDILALSEVLQIRPAVGTSRAQSALEESEGFNRALVQSSRDCIKVLSLDGRLLWMSEHGQRMLCIHDLKRVLGKSWIDFWSEADRDLARAVVASAAAGTEASFLAMYRVNGEPRWFDVLVSPIAGEKGRPGKLLAVSRDVTARWRAERAIDRLAATSEQQRRLYETILSHTPDLVYVLGLDHRFLYANAALLRMWGKRSGEAVGKHFLELGYEPWHAAIHDREIDQVIATQQPIRGEVPFNGTNGRRIYDYIFAPVLGPGGQVEAIAGTTRDVTERKKVEQTLEALVAQRTARLTETIAELEAFSYTVAHDMRAPLRAMQSFSTILTDEHAGALDPQAKDFLDRIALSANRLDHLIKDVLDYSKIVRADPELEPLDTQKLTEEIIHSYPHLQPHQAEILIPAPLPAVIGNRAALTQALANLLGNAVKFVAPGVRPQILVRAEPAADGFVRFWFEDNGIGIEPNAQKSLFQMFQRAHRADQYEGTGMGLAIVRKAIERMGGRVGVESAPGSGSRFWFELKAAVPGV